MAMMIAPSSTPPVASRNDEPNVLPKAPSGRCSESLKTSTGRSTKRKVLGEVSDQAIIEREVAASGVFTAPTPSTTPNPKSSTVSGMCSPSLLSTTLRKTAISSASAGKMK